MDVKKIMTIMSIGTICVAILCVVFIKAFNKYLVLHHDVHLSIDDDNKLKIVNEHFEVTGKSKCPNASLNELHKVGEINKEKSNVSCGTTQEYEGEEKFYKKYKPNMNIYTADSSAQGILGANYMMFNDNPEPYHIDFKLYDNENINSVEGVNYSTNM